MTCVSRVRRSPSIHHFLIPSLAVAVVMAANAAPASAQEAAGSDTVPAHLYAVDGAATIERDGLIETAVENTLLLPGDRLTTDYGRIEVLFADGSALDIDNFTTVDVLSDSLLRLLEGRIRLAVTRNASGANYRVDAAPGSVWIRTAGDYRIALHQPGQSNTELELAVLRGSAELANDVGRTLVRAGTFAVTQASTLPSLPYTLNSAACSTNGRKTCTTAGCRWRRRATCRPTSATTVERSTDTARGDISRRTATSGIRK